MSLRFVTAGESHGPGLTAIVEGLPAGLDLRPEDVDRDLARRQLGHGRGGRMKIEKDRAQVTAGVRHGRTLGSPVAMWVENRDYQNWEERMNPWPVEAEVDEVHLPRPGHADLAGIQKFGHTDVRNVLERASRAGDRRARGGWRTRQGVSSRARGGGALTRHAHWKRCQRPGRRVTGRGGLRGRRRVAGALARRLGKKLDAMVAEIDAARKANESLGGEFEVIAFGLVPGVGADVPVFEAARTAAGSPAIMSIQALKGVGIGDGFALAERVGSKAHDEIFWSDERGYNRETNRAGGIEGGMTTGDPVVVVGAMKPLPTLTKPLRSVDTETKEPAQALRERTDSCTVPAAGVVGEAMVALVLAAAYREKLGGDHMDDAKAALAAYEERIGWRRA